MVQQEPAARLARVLNNAAMELWDGCTSDDADSMWEEAGAIASRILASCRSAKVTNLRNYPGIQFVSPKFPC